MKNRTGSFSIANGDSDLQHEIRCNTCRVKWTCTCGDMNLHEISADLNRCPLCSRTCLHCGQARVTGRWSELCQSCIDVVRREGAVWREDHDPNDDDAPGPEVRSDLMGPRR